MRSSSQHAKIPSPSLPHLKTQKADLCRVWTELCMRKSQARIRNQQLLQDFAELEAQLAVLAAKTDALRRRKRDYEEFLQRLRREDLPEHQGASRKHDLVPNNQPEFLARLLSDEGDGHLPLETEYQSEPLLSPPFDVAPIHASGAHGRLGTRFWEYKQSKVPLDHPFYSSTAHPARKHGVPAFPSLWSPQGLQRDKKAWVFPGQGKSHSSSTQPWPVPGRATVSGRDLVLPEEWLGPVMAQVTEGQTTGSPMASNTLQGKAARRHPILTRGGSAEEHCDMAVKTEGHRLPSDPAELSYHLRLHGEAPNYMDETQLGLLLMQSGNDSSGASVSSSVEVESGHWEAERNTKGLPRQPRMKGEQQDGDTTMILNEEFAPVSWERFPGQLKHEETAIIQGSRKVVREETLPCWEEQGNGELREEEGSKKERSVDEGGEAIGSLDLGPEQTAEECRPVKEEGAQEEEEIRGRAGGLEQGQENQSVSNVGEEGGTAGEGNSLGCFRQGQEDLEEASQAILGPRSHEAESVEAERNPPWSNGEGEKSDQEVEGQSSEKTSKPDRIEESQCDVSGGKEGDLEWAGGSQEGPSCPQKKEAAASISSSSDEVVIGLQMCITSRQDNSGHCQTPSLQSEGPQATGAESTGEEEEDENDEEVEEEEEEDDEEEESEADTDIEAALTPHSNNPATTRDQQGETKIPDFQELKADPEEANKDGDLHDKDDFYD